MSENKAKQHSLTLMNASPSTQVLDQTDTIKLGISQCLLGEKVRFDGGHKLNRYCTKELNKYFDFKPLCPEMGIGMPVPRQTLRLVDSDNGVRALYSKGGDDDFTNQLQQFADRHRQQLNQLSGYIVCRASPSCGLERVKVYNDKGGCEKKGVGLFTERLLQLYPDLPVEEDGRLNDQGLRDSFIKRVYLYHQWQQLRQVGLSPRKVQDFHAKHKFLLLSHCQPTYRKLGPLVASINKHNIDSMAAKYFTQLMFGLKKISSRRNNTNVLMHIQGYLKRAISSVDRQELTTVIAEYKNGEQPLLAPIALLRHHLKHNPDDYLSTQSWFNPYPKTMAIRATF